MHAASNSASGPGYGASVAEWQTARLGLDLCAASVCAYLVCILVVLLASYLAMKEAMASSAPTKSSSQGRFPGQPPIAARSASSEGSWFIQLAATVCSVLGMSAGAATFSCGILGLACLCVTPPNFPGRITAILAEATTIVVFSFSLLRMMTFPIGRYPMSPMGDELPYFVATSSMSFGMGGLLCGILLLVYLYSLGVWFGSQKLVNEVRRFGLVGICTVVATPPVVAIGGLLIAWLGEIMALLAIVAGATIVIVWLLWLAKILFIARSVVPTATVGTADGFVQQPEFAPPEMAEIVPVPATSQAVPTVKPALPAATAPLPSAPRQAAPLAPTWPPGFAPPAAPLKSATPLPATAPKTAVRPKPPASSPPPPKHPLD